MSFNENMIIKTMIVDKKYLTIVTSVFQPEYFDDPYNRELFKKIKKYHETYFKSIDVPLLKSLTETEEERAHIEKIQAIDIDVLKHHQHIIDETNRYLKEQAMKTAIISSVDLLKKGEIGQIEDLIKNALSKDINIDLGLDYFQELGERLQRMVESSTKRIPFYYPTLDELTNGGIVAFTLSVFLAQIHGFKSTLMGNIAARQVMHGHNVVLFTLEMCEDEFARRFDGAFTGYDINRIYIKNTVPHTNFLKEISALYKNPRRGNLIIKQFPTGECSRNDIRMHLRELMIRDMKPDVIYVDYINLMKPSIKTDGMYSAVKRIAEELRSLSYEFEAPVISVSQLNRDGAIVHFDEVSFNYTSESMGIPATSDFMLILGQPEDKFIYSQEVLYKIVKNRLGGRIGTCSKFYYDSRSLRMYDESELDIWVNDAKKTNDERKLHEKTKKEDHQ